MKKVYSNTLGEEVKIKKDGGYMVINVKDEVGDTAEICIPNEYAKHIANSILTECNQK